MGSISSWSDLPLELLSMISNSLKTRIDNSRFRSVCSSWRSSTPPFKNPIQFPFDSNYFHIIEKTVYYLEPCTPQPSLSMSKWLIVVYEFRDDRSFHLLNPFTGFAILPLPSFFPKELDISNFHIIELKKQYRLGRNIDVKTPISFSHMKSFRKVVFSLNANYDKPLLAVLHYSGNLNFFILKNKEWTLVHNIGDWSGFTDIASYKGKVCAITHNGDSIIVDSSLIVAVIAKPSLQERLYYRYLFESSNDLYLVETDDYFIEDIRKKFILVYKLHELDGYKWSKVSNIGGQVFFHAQLNAITYWSFCVSPHQINSCKGNCILFTDYSTIYPEQNSLSGGYEYYTLVCGDKHKISVFDMETGKYGLLEQFPPEWLNI